MTRNLRTQMIDQAEHALRSWAGDMTREEAGEQLPSWRFFRGLTDDMRDEVLGRFPASEPPAVPFVDFLPTLQADADQVVASLDVEVAPKVLTGEVTSPFGPCRCDEHHRDRNCDRFAAEYVEFASAMDCATTLRRMCTPCADATPNVIDRKPLTHAPGGVPVERAKLAPYLALPTCDGECIRQDPTDPCDSCETAANEHAAERAA